MNEHIDSAWKKLVQETRSRNLWLWGYDEPETFVQKLTRILRRNPRKRVPGFLDKYDKSVIQPRDIIYVPKIESLTDKED